MDMQISPIMSIRAVWKFWRSDFLISTLTSLYVFSPFTTFRSKKKLKNREEEGKVYNRERDKLSWNISHKTHMCILGVPPLFRCLAK